jgi:hypothetical protein
LWQLQLWQRLEQRLLVGSAIMTPVAAQDNMSYTMGDNATMGNMTGGNMTMGDNMTMGS